MSFERDRVRVLLKRAASYVGMIAEVKAKSLLLLQRIEVAKKKADQHPDDFIAEVQPTVDQMQKDLAKYSRKLQTINEELRRYGYISDVE